MPEHANQRNTNTFDKAILIGTTAAAATLALTAVFTILLFNTTKSQEQPSRNTTNTSLLLGSDLPHDNTTASSNPNPWTTPQSITLFSVTGAVFLLLLAASIKVYCKHIHGRDIFIDVESVDTVNFGIGGNPNRFIRNHDQEPLADITNDEQRPLLYVAQ